jgi:hypothetical protein
MGSRVNLIQRIPSFGVVWTFYVASTLGIWFGIDWLTDSPTIATCAVVLWTGPGVLCGFKLVNRLDEWRFANRR